MKYLIINADDFGYSKIFNNSILKLLDKGFISSTTVMVNWIDKDQYNQVEKLKTIPNISVGLHLEFSSENFEEEIRRQYKKFKKIFGVKPSHIDLHKSTYLNESHFQIEKFCKENNLPCRNHGINKFKEITTTNEVFNSMNEDIEQISEWLSNLKDGETNEILFHPGKYDPNCKSSYNKEREVDVKKIELLQGIIEQQNINLINFNNLK